MENDTLNDISWQDLVLEEEIGSGAYGSVYRVSLGGKEYALKRILVPENLEESESLCRQFGSRESVMEYCRAAAEDLMGEVRILQKFREDPHIVSVLGDRITETEYGCEIDILMECLVSLPEYQESHPMSEEDVIRLGIDLCSALELCEKEGIRHRDLKPENVLVTKEGTFKLGDFGEAKSLEKTCSVASVRGTFTYMAPEVYYGKKQDKRADLYSLGLVLYQLLNHGQVPFLPPRQDMVFPKEMEDALNCRINGEVIPAPADASEGMAEILLKTCAYYPEKRYQDARALKEDLVRLREGTYRPKKRPSGSFGKRKKTDYLKAAFAALLMVGVLLSAGRGIRFLYREYCVNYCDTDMQEKLASDYGLHLTARLTGNGTLYIDSNDDFFCSVKNEIYPWTIEKDRIKKIVFGEEVNGRMIPEDKRPEAYRLVGVIYDQEALVIVQNDPGENVAAMGEQITVSRDIFWNCKNLKEITFKSREVYCNEAFSFKECYNLAAISCPSDTYFNINNYETYQFSDTPWYQEEGYRILGTTLIKYNNYSEEKGIRLENIPDNIQRIEGAAFSGNESLSCVILPDSVKEIGSSAFSDCSGLTEIMIPDEVRQVGTLAFQNCVSLESLLIPASVTDLGNRTFMGCASLTGLQLQPGNQNYKMEDGVLYNADQTDLIWCSPAAAGTLVLPDSVRIIETRAFADASALTRLVLPEGVNSLTTDLFGACDALTDIVIPESCGSFLREGDFLYTTNKQQIVLCMRDAAGSMEIAAGPEVILGYAFASCQNITDVRLPETVRYILGNAFQNCTNLKSVSLPHSLGMIASNVFSGCTGLTDLYYEGTKEEWESLTARFDLGLEEERTALHFQ